MSASSSELQTSYSSQLQPPLSTLDPLLPYLVASKRSLSTIEHVYRANDVCASTRNALEIGAVTTARTSFLRNGVNSQLNVLQKVQGQIDRSNELARAEYDDILAVLDEAERRLRVTLKGLEDTIVEAKLRPEGEEPRNLLDFVHKDGVEGLVNSIRAEVTDYETGFQDAGQHRENFAKEIAGVTSRLAPKAKNDDSGTLSTPDDDSPIPELLVDMEDRAKEMAVNLESLVSHYDLCVTAIKHTEGGGDAAPSVTAELPKGVDVGQKAREATPAPISDEQRADMMKILQDDAGQVEDVVIEIKSHIAEIETTYQRVESHLEQLAKDHESINSAFTLLEQIGQKLPEHITRSQTFVKQWASERTRIEERLEELDSAKGFYDDFLMAYDSLIIEVGRRKTMETKRERLIQETMSKLVKLYDEDLADREYFKKQQGRFLPGDIWPGLLDPPARFVVTPAQKSVEQIPDIAKSVIHRAIKRVHGSGKA